MYEGKYYANLNYYFKDDVIELSNYKLDEGIEDYLKNFTEYTADYPSEAKIRIPKDEWKNIYLQKKEQISYDRESDEQVKLNFYKPFE